MSSCFARHCICSGEKDDDEEETPPQPCPDDKDIAAIMTNISATRWSLAIYEGDLEFDDVLKEAEDAIEGHVLPEMIYQGSSGSYFVKNCNHDNIGVFKPKDEEPYGLNNPKWAKWFQRLCCPCCFGRGCLVPNSGYLSEAGAFIVDRKLGLNVVPKTKIIRMASSTFHYGKIRRNTAKAKKALAEKFPTVGRRFHRIGLPLKVGSFQIFVNGYKDAISWLQIFEAVPLPDEISHDFQLEFERLVILDYIIRNTDRGNDNWLIRYDAEAVDNVGNKGISTSAFSQGSKDHRIRKIKIAAIDNGLAFPFKHPDEWRAYPFQWARLSHAKTPFSAETAHTFLPFLENDAIMDDLCATLYILFSADKKFQKNVFEKQMAVMRGQAANLAVALREERSPHQLVQMPTLTIKRPINFQGLPSGEAVSVLSSIQSNALQIDTSNKPTLFPLKEIVSKSEFQQEAPFFSTW